MRCQWTIAYANRWRTIPGPKLTASAKRILPDTITILSINASVCWRPLDFRRSPTATVIMNPPSLSIIIPTYNRAELLRASLDSLACQSLSPERYEVIVVDDGSTDATREVCTSF